MRSHLEDEPKCLESTPSHYVLQLQTRRQYIIKGLRHSLSMSHSRANSCFSTTDFSAKLKVDGHLRWKQTQAWSWFFSRCVAMADFDLEPAGATQNPAPAKTNHPQTAWRMLLNHERHLHQSILRISQAVHDANLAFTRSKTMMQNMANASRIPWTNWKKAKSNACC